MKITTRFGRRRLLSGAASLGALAWLPAAGRATTPWQELAAELEAASAAGSRALWQRVRREFQLNPGLIHLNCGSLGATPRRVLDAVSSLSREVEGNPAFLTFGWGEEQMDAARQRLASFIGAEADEVALTRNTTEGMNAVASGLDLDPGDEVLTTDHEHGGGMVCWQHLRKHRGITLVYAEMPSPVVSAEAIVERLRSRITERTRVVSVSHVDTITGVKMPVAAIAAVTRPRDILLVCDGAQAPGMIDVDVKALGVDTYAFSGHKWLLAPKGSGLLYVRRGVQDRVHPNLLHDGYQAYTASSGTRDVAHVLGNASTMDFHEAIGRERVTSRARELSLYLRAQLDELGISTGLTELTPRDESLSGAMMSFALKRGDAREVVARMNDEHQVVLKLAQSTYAYCEEDGLPRKSYNAIRFSTHVFNDENDLDRAVAALRKVMAKA